jgi:dTDP-D-glucose 4,6-dehydratase
MIINHAAARPGDVKFTLGSIDKINEELGWIPRKEFWAGLRSTLKWWGLLDDDDE